MKFETPLSMSVGWQRVALPQRPRVSVGWQQVKIEQSSSSQDEPQLETPVIIAVGPYKVSATIAVVDGGVRCRCRSCCPIGDARPIVRVVAAKLLRDGLIPDVARSQLSVAVVCETNAPGGVGTVFQLPRATASCRGTAGHRRPRIQERRHDPVPILDDRL